ncbi:MAG: tyrosine-protein phosphatase [Streptomyces sp.]|nr:tyrosine-protein phosphatase [Streptomyces sp.]NUS15325.1 tyrosine-protein phosphatase [Streptomyces sp.]
MRAVPIEGTHALFDVSGEALHDGTAVLPRRLLRSGFTAPLSPAAASGLRAYGVTSVIDLRSPREVAKAPGILVGAEAVRHRLVPVGDEASAPRPGTGLTLGELYLRLAGDHGAAILEVARLVAGQGDGAVLVHCTTGRDRTGLVVSVILRAAGVPQDAVVAQHRRVSAAVAGYVAMRRLRWLAKGRDPARFEALHQGADQALVSVLRWMDDRFGGAASYLRAHGGTPELITALRGVLTEGRPARTGASASAAGDGGDRHAR